MRCWASSFLLGTAVLLSSACAGPITQVGSVSRADVESEQQEQIRLAAKVALENQQRVDRLAAPLLNAAAPLCGMWKQTKPRRQKSGAGFVAPSESVCPFGVIVARDDQLNAASDGSKIYVNTAMLRFASDDELSVVLAHEIAHNAMHHRDAKERNALGGALLGALADIAMAAGGRNTGGEYTRMGAQAGAQAFSQDFEREADYIGLYILAWAGRPVDSAAQFWRRIAVEHPAGIVFASTHPTTAERFVRLDKWAQEIDAKVASGVAFGPEMKDPRLQVASRPVRTPRPTVSGGEVLVATRSDSESHPLGVDAGPKSSFAPADAPAPQPMAAAPKTPLAAAPSAPKQPTVGESDDERFARATIGAPSSEADRDAALPAYERGMAFLGAHDWGRAEAEFKKALRFDGSVAAYHAGLGEVLMVEEDWAGAAAEYTAALLIDVDNDEYRARLKEARSRK